MLLCYKIRYLIFDNILRNIIVTDCFLSSLNSLAFSVEINFKIWKCSQVAKILLILMETWSLIITWSASLKYIFFCKILNDHHSPWKLIARTTLLTFWVTFLIVCLTVLNKHIYYIWISSLLFYTTTVYLFEMLSECYLQTRYDDFSIKHYHGTRVLWLSPFASSDAHYSGLHTHIHCIGIITEMLTKCMTWWMRLLNNRK